MELDRPDCTLVDREDRIAAYVAGTLGGDEAEAFEAHYFACNQCWHEVQRGLEIRAAAGAHAMPLRSQMLTPVARHVPWRWLAAAASVVLAVSLWRLAHRTLPEVGSDVRPESTAAAPAPTPTPAPSPAVTPATSPVVTRPAAANPTLRSASQKGLRPSAVRRANGDLQITWASIEKAAHYRIRIYASDGMPVLDHETTDPTLSIDASALAQSAGKRLFASVEAINALGVTVTTSPPIPLPARK